MSEFLFFIIGTLFGSITGIICMCLVQINRISRFPKRGEENGKEKQTDTLPPGQRGK